MYVEYVVFCCFWFLVVRFRWWLGSEICFFEFQSLVIERESRSIDPSASSFIPNSLRTTIDTADHHHSSLIFTAGNQTYLLRHSNLETANHRLNHTESNHNAPYRRNISREDEREGREDEQYHCCKSKQLFQNRISNHCHFYQKVRWLMIGQTNLKLSISTFLQHYS